MQNPFVWHDLMTTDVEGAKKFYGAVVGWTFQPPMDGYHVGQVGDAGVIGIMDTPPHVKGMPPFWSGYVYTPDVDAAAAQAKKLGGEVKREPWDVPNMLRLAVLADPTGAHFNIMAPLSQEERKMAPEGAAGTVGWNELHAGDLGKAWDFYSKMFGWTKGAGHDMGPDVGVYQLFQIGGQDVGGMMKKMPMTPMPVWQYYFNVNGIDAAAQRITRAGGTIAMGPHEVPGGNWIVTGQDPQGAFFSLLSKTK